MEVFEKVEGVAKQIGLSASTVKKYYSLFEEQGYRFQRSVEGHILFTQYEVDLFKQLIDLKNQPGMTVPKAVTQLVRAEGIIVVTDPTDSTDMQVMTEQVKTVMTDIAELKQLVQAQSELIKRQQEYIDQKLEKRDQLLLDSIREIQEEKRAMLETVATNEKGSGSFFSRLFGKK